MSFPYILNKTYILILDYTQNVSDTCTLVNLFSVHIFVRALYGLMWYYIILGQLFSTILVLSKTHFVVDLDIG